MADLSVVAVSYNVRDLLDACLRSVVADCSASGIAARLLVVDNASSAGSADMVAATYPEADVIRSEENLRFGGGANRALRYLGFPAAPGEPPVLLLNPDTEVRPGAIARMLGDLSAWPQAGVVGPALVYPDGRPQHAAFAFPGLVQATLDLFPIHWRLTASRLNGRYAREERLGFPYRCDHVLGAAMLLRPAAIAAIGLFDEGFFMYCEEVDWCWRAAQRGWQTWSAPRAVVVHHSGSSTSQVAGSMYVELWRSRYRLMRKHGGRIRSGLMRPIVRLGMLRRRLQADRDLSRAAITPEQHAASLLAFSSVAAL